MESESKRYEVRCGVCRARDHRSGGFGRADIVDYLYVAANGDLTVMDMQRVTGSGPTVITAGRSNTKAGGRTVLFPQPFDGGEELEQSSRHVPERAKPQRPLQAVEERGIKRKCRRGHVIAATKQQLLKRIAAADRTHAESVFLPAIGS